MFVIFHLYLFIIDHGGGTSNSYSDFTTVFRITLQYIDLQYYNY